MFDSDFLILLFNLIFCIEACNLSPNIMNDLIQKSLLNLKMVDWLTKELLSRECVLLILKPQMEHLNPTYCYYKCYVCHQHSAR